MQGTGPWGTLPSWCSLAREAQVWRLERRCDLGLDGFDQVRRAENLLHLLAVEPIANVGVLENLGHPAARESALAPWSGSCLFPAKRERNARLGASASARCESA